ncbi:MAG: phosphonoacetate hydrolase [Geminicoccales bacterium]
MNNAGSDGRIVSVNGRDYAWPKVTTVVICIDGSEPAYIERAIADGLMPNMAGILERGVYLKAASAMPSFTNPNNLSIVTGCPPAVHGIAGNYLLDPETAEKVMMNDPKFLRAPTIFPAFQKAGAKIAVVTAKDKLRRLLGHGLVIADGRDGGAICFSSEKADEATLTENGIENLLELVGQPLPDVYSAELSGFVMAAGVKIAKQQKPDLMYLSTTDYIQHKFEPGSDGANTFYTMMDGYIGALDALGCTLVMVADHGMNAKHKADGTPDVIYLQDVLDDWLGEGLAEVICPITDPYVVHHGALGSFVTAYLPKEADATAIVDRLRAIDGIDTVQVRAEAAVSMELPPDRIGDIVVTSTRHVVIGAAEAAHDLSGLDAPLRSHGGFTEQTVPFMVNRPTIDLDNNRKLRNFDAFDVALNHVQVRD